MAESDETEGTAPPSSRLTDIAFDIRTVIGSLFAVYGLVCLVWGLVSFPAEAAEKTGGINLNLWAGLGMLLTAAAFVTWVLAAPIHPDEDAEQRRAAAASGGEDR